MHLASKRKPKNDRLGSALVAVTGEASDDDAVRLACELLDSQKGDLFIVYVIEVERGLPVDAEISPATARAEQVLKHVEGVAKAFKGNAEAELLQSRRAGAALVHEAVDKNVDAIVMGIPYREQYGTFSLGDAVPYVLRNAPCKVILWRESMTAPFSSDGATPGEPRLEGSRRS